MCWVSLSLLLLYSTPACQNGHQDQASEYELGFQRKLIRTHVHESVCKIILHHCSSIVIHAVKDFLDEMKTLLSLLYSLRETILKYEGRQAGPSTSLPHQATWEGSLSFEAKEQDGEQTMSLISLHSATSAQMLTTQRGRNPTLALGLPAYLNFAFRRMFWMFWAWSICILWTSLSKSFLAFQGSRIYRSSNKNSQTNDFGLCQIINFVYPC